jgi:agmatinase
MSSDNSHRFGKFPDESTEYDSSKIVILPIPFDLTSTWMKGADKGPDAVFHASKYLELYDIETGIEVYRKGIHTLGPLIKESAKEMVSEASAKVSGLLADGKFVVSLGGEHTIAIGPAWAHAERYKEMSVLQLDAHSDLRNDFEGEPYNHACTMARIRERAAHTISVGIRSMDSSEIKAVAKNPCFMSHEIANDRGWITKVIDSLRPNVYVTIDIDVFEIGIMPSTGTPEPGGLGWHDVMRLLKELSETRDVVGFDVCELCPSSNKAPDYLTSKLIYQFLSYIFASR